MLLTLICLLLLVLALAALLLRQIAMTKQAVEEAEMWKRLYKSSYLKHEAAAQKSGQVNRQKNTPAAHPQPIKPATRRHTKTKEYRGETAKTAPPPAEKVDTMSEILTLVLPIQLLSKNARDKLHHQAKNRLRKDYQDIIEIKYPRRAPAPQERQRATVTRILGPRERRFDQQNVGAGSAIELIDALTRAGYWVNDSEKWLETHFEQASSKKFKGPAVTVEIEVLS